MIDDRSAGAAARAWLSADTVPVPRAIVRCVDAYERCRAWCEQNGCSAPDATEFRDVILAHGCEIERQRCQDESGKYFEYAIVHLKIGKGGFTGSTLRMFEVQRLRRLGAGRDELRLLVAD